MGKKLKLVEEKTDLDQGCDDDDDDDARISSFKKLKTLFDSVLPSFLRDFSPKHSSLPLPSLLEDGQEMELFNLFRVVRVLGGYNQLSNDNSWEFAAKECLFECEKAANVKSLFEKYLLDFDKWLKGEFIEMELFDEEFNMFSQELETGFQALAVRKLDSTNNEHGLGEDKSIHDKGSLSQMLDWVLMAAKGDQKVGKIPPPSHWKDYSFDKIWLQALWARESVVTKRFVRPNIEQSLFQRKLKVHPLMYDDSTDFNQRLRDKFIVNDRLYSYPECRLFACDYPCKSSHGREVIHIRSPSKRLNSRKKKGKNMRKTIVSKGKNMEEIKKVDQDLFTKFEPRPKRIGPLYQALVFKWTECIPESDSKWLGTTTCLPEDEFINDFTSISVVGKGRNETCKCEQPCSIFCTMFHIAEKRVELKLQLGSLFYEWKFDNMGEDVSLSWTKKQEHCFNTIVKPSHPLNKKFWENTWKLFPNKTRENVLNYYFNVFILRRRRYQNWATPNAKDLDSDDEDKGLGTIGDNFNLESLDFIISNLPPCVENKENLCIELESRVEEC